MAIRVPSIIRDTISRNPDYPPSIHRGLDELAERIERNDTMELFPPPAPDYEHWKSVFEAFSGEGWLSTEWLFAEFFAYRWIVQATLFWETGRDPFVPFKRAELNSVALLEVVREALDVDGTIEQKLRSSLEYTLWGNQMDQSIKQIAERGMQPRKDRLLIDHLDTAAELLARGEAGDVHIVMDNAGTEQALDFVFVDLLLRERRARKVVLHVKAHPVLVSDVIPADMGPLLARLSEGGKRTSAMAERLSTAIAAGTLKIEADLFWNLPLRFWELPAGIESQFGPASLVVVKGDANYRRMTNDAIWPYEATLSDALPHFPAPLLALRTSKSDTLVGVDEKTCARLDVEDPDWRTNGKYAVAEFVRGSTF